VRRLEIPLRGTISWYAVPCCYNPCWMPRRSSSSAAASLYRDTTSEISGPADNGSRPLGLSAMIRELAHGDLAPLDRATCSERIG